MKRVILLEDKRIKEKTKVKVVAYCRVSTDHIHVGFIITNAKQE